MKTEEMIGMKFGRWLATELAGYDQYGKALVKCICKCGTVRTIQAGSLKSGHTTSCGCLNKERHAVSREEMFGQRYGKAVATELAGVNQHGNALVKCLCDCGNTFVALAKDLKSGHTTSCGCWQREAIAEVGKDNAMHGLSGTAEYEAWFSMKARCDNPANASFKYYGARGIKVCDRWRDSLEAFLMDVGPKPGKSYHLHRKSRNDDYGPDTTAWATHKQCKADRAAERSNK